MDRFSMRGRRALFDCGAILFCCAIATTCASEVTAQGSRLAERLAARRAAGQDAGQLPRREWTIEGTKREALVFAPEAAKTQAAPVVFAFHGHGGTAPHAARTFRYQHHWPEAIVVYMQGLNTPGKLTDPEGKKPGWQSDVGEQGNRDLKFFDAVLGTLEKDYRVDRTRIYATGHSNGGSFTYLLWGECGDVFAAVAPSAAIPPRGVREKLKPLPVLHVAGTNDELVKYQWQKLAIDLLKKVNQTEPTGKAWAKHTERFESPNGKPVATFITDGTHKFPEDAPEVIVKFFREQSRAK